MMVILYASVQMTNSSCYWVGNAPICLGSCKFAGDYVAKKSPTGDGMERAPIIQSFCRLIELYIIDRRK
jgi:hypothetical protein